MKYADVCSLIMYRFSTTQLTTLSVGSFVALRGAEAARSVKPWMRCRSVRKVL